MSRIFENSDGVRIMDCLDEVWARAKTRRCNEIEPIYMVTVTLSNGEELSWTSERLYTIRGIENDDKWRESLNKGMTMAYLINVATGEAYGKKVIEERKEEVLGKTGLALRLIERLVGADIKKTPVENFKEGEKLKVVKLEVKDRDEMPIEEVLETLPMNTHPRWLCEYDKNPLITGNSTEHFIEDLKKYTDRLNGYMRDEELAVVLCKIVDEIFRVYYKTGIRFDLVWDDYANSIVTGSTLRTKEIIEAYKEIQYRLSGENKENSREE